MYHYVRPAPEELPFFRYLHVDDFIRQLDWAAGQGRFVPRDEFLDCVEQGRTIEDGIVLTFDDGLADHYDHVLPMLAERNLWGMFFVSSGPHADGRMLDVHRIHRLLGAFGGTRMLAALDEMVEPAMFTEHDLDQDRILAQNDDQDTARFKRMMTYHLKAEWRGIVLDRLMRCLCADERDLVAETYLGPAQIREMQQAGMIMGGHGISHAVLGTMALDDQRREIDQSMAFLEEATGGLEVRSFCYPYGGFYAFTADTERLVAEAGCRFAFNVEPRPIAAEDFARRPMALPRFDCNQFPHGTARMGGGKV